MRFRKLSSYKIHEVIKKKKSSVERRDCPAEAAYKWNRGFHKLSSCEIALRKFFPRVNFPAKQLPLCVTPSLINSLVHQDGQTLGELLL